MGSMIEFAAGRLAIDFGKNEYFTDHSALFQETDLSVAPYEYVREAKKGESEDDWKNRIYVEWKRGLQKPLWQVVDRLKLLGYTADLVKMDFEWLASQNYIPIKKSTYTKVQRLIAETDLNGLFFDNPDQNRGFDLKLTSQIKKLIDPSCIIDEYPTFGGEGFECLQPYTVLHLLNNNPSAKDLPVYWAFDDVEEGGYAPLSSFVKPLDPSKKFLIVTEGSSDAKIIRHALTLLYPHVEDFFTFVDMEEGYPFTGTGNMINFIKGLISISIQNNVVVLFDNDAEGVDTYKRCSKLTIPDNMAILTLPELRSFNKFNTVGPTGTGRSNINGRAVSIECFLQLDKDAAIRWTTYRRDTNCYQGELIKKDTYKKEFLSQKEKLDTYDYSKLEKLIQLIFKECTLMQENSLSRILHY